jgi:hypothetical protein
MNAHFPRLFPGFPLLYLIRKNPRKLAKSAGVPSGICRNYQRLSGVEIWTVFALALWSRL